MRIGRKRAKMLLTIWELSKQNEFKVAFVSDLEDKLERSYGALLVALGRAKEVGLVENPIHGGWRLTEEGIKVLEELNVIKRVLP